MPLDLEAIRKRHHEAIEATLAHSEVVGVYPSLCDIPALIAAVEELEKEGPLRWELTAHGVGWNGEVVARFDGRDMAAQYGDELWPGLYRIHDREREAP